MGPRGRAFEDEVHQAELARAQDATALETAAQGVWGSLRHELVANMRLEANTTEFFASARDEAEARRRQMNSPHDDRVYGLVAELIDAEEAQVIRPEQAASNSGVHDAGVSSDNSTATVNDNTVGTTAADSQQAYDATAPPMQGDNYIDPSLPKHISLPSGNAAKNRVHVGNMGKGADEKDDDDDEGEQADDGTGSKKHNSTKKTQSQTPEKRKPVRLGIPNWPWGSSWKFKCDQPNCNATHRPKNDFQQHMNKHCRRPRKRQTSGFVIVDLDEKKLQWIGKEHVDDPDDRNVRGPMVFDSAWYNAHDQTTGGQPPSRKNAAKRPGGKEIIVGEWKSSSAEVQADRKKKGLAQVRAVATTAAAKASTTPATATTISGPADTSTTAQVRRGPQPSLGGTRRGGVGSRSGGVRRGNNTAADAGVNASPYMRYVQARRSAVNASDSKSDEEDEDGGEGGDEGDDEGGDEEDEEKDAGGRESQYEKYT